MRRYEVRVDKAAPVYRSNYFPRGFHYKKDAETCAEEARRSGCTNVRVERLDKEHGK